MVYDMWYMAVSMNSGSFNRGLGLLLKGLGG